MKHDYESNRSQGERAADNFLAQTLPAHGRHSWPNALADTVRDNGTGNGSIVIPSRAVPSAERTGNVYETKLADPLASPRRGRVQSAEGITSRDPNVERTFAEGFTNARAYDAPAYEVQPAGTRSPLANGIIDSGNPAWIDDRAALFNFAHGTSAEMRLGNIPPLSERSSISQVGVRLDQLDLSERGRVTYGKTYAVPGRRYNAANVED